MRFVRSLGADKALEFSDFASISQLEYYDLVLDPVEKRRTSAPKKACAKALSAGGAYVSIDDEGLLLHPGRLDRVTKLVESGATKPATYRIYRFDQIVQAHTYAECGHKRGDVAVTINQQIDTI